MPSVEFLHNRITGKKKELEKLNKKLARILEAKEFNYKDHNPYYYHEDDLKYTARDIERCEKAISDLEEKLAKELDQEAKRKYDFIIERTNAIVGQITDASNLCIGAKGDLNGYIIGTDGKAKVQTVGAGGYNIMCFHYRTLINPMK